MVLWAADTSAGATASQAAKAGLVAWAWVHHGTVHVPSGIVGFTPPGLLLLPLWLTRRSARHRYDEPPPDLRGALMATASLAVPYTALAVGVAALASTQGIRADPITTGVGALGLATLGVGSWTLRTALLHWWTGRSQGLVLAARVGGMAVASLLAMGSLAVAFSLAWHYSLAAELSNAITTSFMGTLGLLLLGIALAPAAAVWAVSVGAGPGFALGAQTSVTAGTVHLGGVPAVSLAAALPASGSAPWTLRILPFMVAIVGLVAGVIMHRRGESLPLTTRCGWTVVAGAVAGAGIAALAALSGGPLAPGRLATVGPSAWHVGLAVTEEIALVGALTVGALHWWRARRS